MGRKKENTHQGLYVKVKNNNLEYALKLLKRKIKDSNLMVEMRNHESFTKPSAKRRDKKNRAKRRAQMQTQQKK